MECRGSYHPRCFWAAAAVAGGLKVGHPAELAASIAGFRLLPAEIVGPLALALPYVELMLGSILVCRTLHARRRNVAAAAQFFCYAGAVASAVCVTSQRTADVSAPTTSRVADWPHVAFDLALAVAVIFVAYGAPGALAVDRKLRNA